MFHSNQQQSSTPTADGQEKRTPKPIKKSFLEIKKDQEAPDVDQRKINESITAKVVRLVTEEGHQVLPLKLAIQKAKSLGLDLVEINGKAQPPVCRLMDYKKFKFEERRKEKEQRKKQLEKRRLDEVKEVRIGSRTDVHDVQLKTTMALKFLEKGHRVKLAVQFRKGDRNSGTGQDLLATMIDKVQLYGKVENGPKDEGHQSWALIRPKKQQHDVLEEQHKKENEA